MLEDKVVKVLDTSYYPGNIMIVLGLTATNGVDKEIAEALKASHVVVEHKVFPDGESYIRIPVSVDNEHVVIVQSTYKPQDKHLVELLLAVEAVKDLGAKTITVITPYLAYARQDKRFRTGEAISIKTILRSIRCAGADTLIVVEIHKEHVLTYFTGTAINVSAMDALAEYFKDKVENPLVLAPDTGALPRAKRFAEIIGGDYDYLEKTRDRITGEVKVRPKTISVKGRVVVIVDDIISTGKTMALAAKQALENGAREVYAACAHALFVDGAYERLRKAGIREVVATNTVPVPKGVVSVSVAPYIAKTISELYG